MAVKSPSPVVGADHQTTRLKGWAVALVTLTTVFLFGALILGEFGLPLTSWGKVVFGVVAAPLVVAFHMSQVAWRRERKAADLLPGGAALLVLLAMVGMASDSGYVWIFSAYVLGLGGLLWLGRTALRRAPGRPRSGRAATGGPAPSAERDGGRATAPAGLEAPPRMHLLPRCRVGWWALGLLLLAGTYPLYWNLLMDNIPDVGVAVLAAVLVLTPLVLARVAIFRKNDRSVLLIALAGGTLLVVLFGVLFAVALALQALA